MQAVLGWLVCGLPASRALTRQSRYFWRCYLGDLRTLEALEIRKRSLGEDHSDTLWSLAGLASIYDRQDRKEEAEQVSLNQDFGMRNRCKGLWEK